MVLEMRTAAKEASDQSCVVKCFTEEVMKRMQPRTPFQELQEMNEEMFDNDMGRKDCGDEAECSACSWAEFELELSDYDRKEISPVVDSLLVEVSSDFFFGGGNLGAANIIPQQSVSQRSENIPAAALLAQKSPKEQLMHSASAEDGNLIKAEYNQPPVSGQRCNLASMMAEKSSLKRELRALDVEFEKREGRKPSKAEKEHLRPMYVRYWKLKHQIGKLQSVAPKAAMSAAVC